MRTLVALSSFLSAIALSLTCRAQTTHAEDDSRPFFFRGGAGLNLSFIHESRATINGEPQVPPTEDYLGYGYDIDLEVGVSLARHLVLGGMLYLTDATGHPEPGLTEQRGNGVVAALVDGFLVRTGEGPHVLGFAGLTNFRARFAGGVGAGYDFKLAERWSVGPLVRVIYLDGDYDRTIATTLDAVVTFN
jgi:hypothetical protein